MDFVQSWGALLFGHARAEIVEAASAAAARGHVVRRADVAARSSWPSGSSRPCPASSWCGSYQRHRGDDERDPARARRDRTRPAREVRGVLPRSLRRAARQGCRQRARDARHPGVARRDRGRGAATRSPAPFNDLDAVRAIFAERGERRRRRRWWSRSPRTWASSPPEPGFLEGLRATLRRARRPAAVRRGDHRVPHRVRRRAVALRRDARPHHARQDHGRRVPVRGVRRTRPT